MPRHADPNAHETLLQAARAEFAQHGLDGARIEDIARRAGLAKGSFYLHFHSKEDVFRELLQRLFGMLEEHARRRTEAEACCIERIGRLRPEDFTRGNRRFEEALEVEIQADVELLEALWNSRDLLSAIDKAGTASQRLIDAFRQKMRDHIVGSAMGRQSQGRMRADADPSAVADMVLGGYETFLRRMAPLKAKPDLQAWVRTVMLVIYQGAFSEPQAATPRARRERTGS